MRCSDAVVAVAVAVACDIPRGNQSDAFACMHTQFVLQSRVDDTNSKLALISWNIIVI